MPAAFQNDAEELEFYFKLAASLNESYEVMRPAFKIVRDNIDPWRGFRLEGKGSNRDPKDILSEDSYMINDQSRKSLMICAAGISQGTMPKTQPWIRLTLDDEDMAEFYSVRAWLDEYAKRMMSFIARSNGYAVAKEGNAENILFGTEAFIIENDWQNGMNFIGHTAGEYSIGYGRNKEVQFLSRCVPTNVYDLVDTYGIDKVTTQVANDYRLKNYFKEYDLQELFMPKARYTYGGKNSDGHTYQSIKFLGGEGERKVLGRGSFQSRPFVAPRPWGVIPGRVWGYGPGFWSVGSSRQLEMLEAKKLKGLDKVVDPALTAPDSMKDEDIDQSPGGLIYYPQGMNPDAVRPLSSAGIDLNAVGAEISNVQARIGAGYFNDFFLSITQSDKEMTMFETARRYEEKIAMIGPVLERLHEEKLVPMVERVAEIMRLRGLVPKAPPELPADLPIKIEFISPLAQAQKLIGTSNLQQYVAFITSVAAIDKGASLVTVDLGQLLRDGAESFAVNPKSTRSPEEVAQITGQAQQQMQTQTMLAAAKPLSEAALNASKTDTGDGASVLQKITEASSGAR